MKRASKFLSRHLRIPASACVHACKSVLLLLFAVALLPVPAVAEDTLNSVLQRMRVQDTRHFSYRETRHLHLLAQPWQADGDLYIAPRQMLIARTSPTLATTLITAAELRYNDAGQDRQRRIRLDRPFAVAGMEPLMRLLYGSAGRTELEQQYLTRFEVAAQRWTLQLAPHSPAGQAVSQLRLSGESGRGPDRLLLETSDGDRTEWQWSLLSQGVAAERELQQALEPPGSP